MRMWMGRIEVLAVGSILLAAALAGCGGATASEPAPAATVTATVTASSGQDSQSNQVGGGQDDIGDIEGSFTMPEETGKSLQAAQDDLQAVSGNPFFFSDSEDATGQDRGQWVDSGWQVCSQDPAPGAQVRDDEDDVVFFVVRASETCP